MDEKIGKKTTKPDYVKLQVYLPEAMDAKLRQFIARRYQTFEKGLLSHEVQQAIGYWLNMHTSTQTFDVQPPNPLPKIGKYYAEMKQWLLTGYFEELIPGSIITMKHLDRAIQNTRGYDKRTVDKWKRRFVENKLLRILGTNQIELIA